MSPVGEHGRCGDCAHFRNDPAYLEAVIGGLVCMGSAYASVGADDGLCQLHGRHSSARSRCADFTSAAAAYSPA